MTGDGIVRRAFVSNSTTADSLGFNALGAATVLLALSNLHSGSHPGVVLDDIAKDAGILGESLRKITETMVSIGLLEVNTSGLRLMVSASEAQHKAAFLQGFAYAQHQQRDLNQVEITLSPPSRPSRLMEILPKQGFAWAGLHETKDNLIDLASRSVNRLVIVSPFIDDAGLDWIAQLFNTAAPDVKRILIVRGADSRVKALLRGRTQFFQNCDAKLYSYAVPRSGGDSPLGIETFHAKIVLADRDKAYIGSSNMNLASREISMECGVTLTGPCVRPVAALIDTIISISQSL